MRQLISVICHSSSQEMGCFPSEALRVRLSHLCERVRCIFACCGGKIVIQNSQVDGETKRSPGPVTENILHPETSC